MNTNHLFDEYEAILKLTLMMFTVRIMVINLKYKMYVYLATFTCECSEVEPGRWFSTNFAQLVHLEQ